MGMLKVLHVSGTMNRGGAEVMIMDVFKQLSEDIKFDFLINYNKSTGILEGDFDNDIKALGGNIYQIPTQWEIGPLKYFSEFKKVIDKAKPDIVHIHMNSKSGIIAWAAKKAGIKCVITHAHADIKFRGNFAYRFISNIEMKFQKILIQKYSDQFWGCSEQANDSLFGISKDKNKSSRIIKNAIDSQSFLEVDQGEVKKLKLSYDLSEETLVLGNVGRIVPHKNLLFIIEILNELNKRNVNFKFVYAGRADDKDYLESVNNKIKDIGIDDKVIYLGLRNDIPVVMNSFDIFLGPALREGFGLVAVEAQAAGVPALLYKGFPQDVDMNIGLVNFIDSFNVHKWVDLILLNKSRKSDDKDSIIKSIKENGFDSFSNSQIIESYYKKCVK
ncbi:glycosyltransferase [Robertkochia flava]|uniref:glycosyltransferase n=1 Tax=Robertkochia flava TaxID=3447986 RepID=UPI001CCC3E99|nr:glycosyltransferase [Robertkochia marina]